MKMSVWKSDSDDVADVLSLLSLTQTSHSAVKRVKTGSHVSFKLQHMNTSEVKNITSLQWHLSKGVMCSVTQHLNS